MIDHGQCWIQWGSILRIFRKLNIDAKARRKKEQQLRETSTLQALFFNKNPTDPLEPDGGLSSRLECKPIPLEDTSGEEEVNDYTSLGWPEPVFDKFMVNNQPPPSSAPVTLPT